MVRIRSKLLGGKFLYIPRLLQKSGFTGEIEMAPNLIAAAIYPANASKEAVIKSLMLVVQDLENELAQQSSNPTKKKAANSSLGDEHD